jgi:hypothetical protein
MRPHMAPARAGAAAAFAWCLLACVAGPASAADTVDIQMHLYRDGNCFEKVDEFMLLDEGCYANLYNNASRAYQIKITKFQGEQEVDLREYIDACNYLFRPKKSLKVGKCEHFIGSTYVKLNTRFRSDACQGDSCSTLSVGVQRFYSQEYCRGIAYDTFLFPLQGECMRWGNGSQTFRIDADGTNITQVDYIGNDRCEAGSVTRMYSMRPGTCFPLFTDKSPRSFSWTLEGGIAVKLASASQRSAELDFLTGASMALAMVMVHTGVPGWRETRPASPARCASAKAMR